MRTIAGLVFFYGAIGVSANLKAPSFPLAQTRDSARPGMLKSFESRSTLTQRLNPMQSFQRPPVRPDKVFPWTPTVIAKATDEEKEAPPKEEAAPEPATAGLKNVYGEKLADCGPENLLCTFDGDSSDICMISPKFAGFAVPPYDKQKKEDCKSIFASNLRPMPDGALPIEKSADIPVCNAMPAELLTSQFSQATWSKKAATTEWSLEGTYLYEAETVTQKKEFGSRKQKFFRNSIDILCRFCGSQAPSDSAKKALDKACKGLGWSEAFVYGRPMDIDAKPASLFSEPSSSDDISIFALAFMGLLVGSGLGALAFIVRSIRAKEVQQDGARYVTLM